MLTWLFLSLAFSLVLFLVAFSHMAYIGSKDVGVKDLAIFDSTTVF